MTSPQEHLLNLAELEQRYRNQLNQMSELCDDLTRLRDFMVANGAGTYTAITATLAEHEARLNLLECPPPRNPLLDERQRCASCGLRPSTLAPDVCSNPSTHSRLRRG
jgi:hypothetical protein